MVPLKSSTFAVTRIYKLVVSVVTTHIVHSIRTVIVNGLTLKYTQYTSSNFGLILSYDLFIQFVLNTHPKLSKFTQCFASFLYKQLPGCWLNMLQFGSGWNLTPSSKAWSNVHGQGWTRFRSSGGNFKSFLNQSTQDR